MQEAERKLWHYATDCVTKGRLADLADAPDLELVMVCQALNYGLSYTHHTDRRRSGYITPQQARAVLKTRGSIEPDSPAILPTDFSKPVICKPDHGAAHWPINTPYQYPRERAVWGLIVGIEKGWFAYDCSGFLQWSEAGRDRYASGGPVVVDSRTGQSAFDF